MSESIVTPASEVLRFWDIPVSQSEFTKHYITAYVTTDMSSHEEVKGVFKDLYAYMLQQDIIPLQEKVYGAVNSYETIMKLRQEAIVDVGSKVTAATFIDGGPCTGGIFTGVQIIAARANKGPVEIYPTRHNEARIEGMVLETSSFKEVFLAGVSGKNELLAEDQRDNDLYGQTHRMFSDARDALAEHGLGCRDIPRTWIYFPRLLDWYGEFNHARTDWFKMNDMITDHDFFFPASTGIQGKRRKGEEIYMDVLGFKTKDDKTARMVVMNNTHQNEANDYGSAFARGMAIEVENTSTLYVSGTASIDNSGKTVYHDNNQNQICETLLDIAALIKTQGGKMEDLALAAVYCKNQDVYDEFIRITESFGLDHLPFVPMIADVCRDELLVEIDSVVIRTTN